MIRGSIHLDSPSQKPKKIQKFIERKVLDWVKERGPSDQLSPEDIEYFVEFHSDGGPEVSCHTEIRVGPARWAGSDYSKDTQRAFMDSLKRLSDLHQLH